MGEGENTAAGKEVTGGAVESANKPVEEVEKGAGETKESEKPKEPVDEKEAAETKESDPTIKVNSANDWEHADLGDQSRKEKFLKLMGAAKTEHTGKIVIGEDGHKHKSGNPEELNKGLEDQFQHGLEHKLKSGYKGHLGLGFTQDENGAAKTDSADSKVDEKGEEKTTDTSVSPTADKRANSGEGEAAVPKKKPMMTFVKASNS